MKHVNILYRYIAAALCAGILWSCGGAKLAVADEQMERGEYYDASRTYRAVYNKLKKREERPLRGEVAYKMGLCYRKLNMSARASAAFQNAVRYAYPDSLTQLYLAQSLQAEGRYRDAITAYQEYLATDPKDAETAETGIAGCRKGMGAKATPTRYIVKQAKLFNSRRADFSPMFAGADHDVLYFTTTNEKVTGDRRSEITGMKKGDIWVARKNEQGQWQRPEAVEGELNSEHDEGIVSFTPDGGTMYLTRARREPNAHTGVEIYTSQRSDAKWSAPVKFEITADTLSSYGHPAVSPDGDWLIFASDMPGGMGGLDLWRINLKDRVGSLENLGEFINTPGDECFPYMRSDSVIYFASDGHAGLGGLDLFRAEQTPSGGWNVTNMGYPVNSSSDDFGITFGEGESGYFSSNRTDGRGYDHIYSFLLPDLKINISGMVLDKDEEPVPNSVIRIVGDDGSNQKATGKADGSFSFPLQRGVRYVMLAGAKGYLNAKQEFRADTAEVDAEYGVDFILASINKPNVVDNIFYDFDKATLRPESKTALDSIVQVLRDNPNVTIEMASHTDRWGTEEYNQRLSQRRAQSVIDYLIAAGIRPERLSPQGYGESHPKTITKRLARQYPQFKEGDILTEEFILTLPEADQEVADQINRRTEFQVLSIDYNIF
ncbi:OmpA family protein [uncultured Muribaculum sp.]|uniref:PorE family type IX secretion system protein n=1 Tax=uncultured Muribaculum sp. TaxID=1918613 RepID=UPI0025FA3553|nr:OmpA family protein [uncultured Muribaculum sp.]